jgi:hypothetical protein
MRKALDKIIITEDMKERQLHTNPCPPEIKWKELRTIGFEIDTSTPL